MHGPRSTHHAPRPRGRSYKSLFHAAKQTLRLTPQSDCPCQLRTYMNARGPNARPAQDIHGRAARTDAAPCPLTSSAVALAHSGRYDGPADARPGIPRGVHTRCCEGNSCSAENLSIFILRRRILTLPPNVAGAGLRLWRQHEDTRPRIRHRRPSPLVSYGRNQWHPGDSTSLRTSQRPSSGESLDACLCDSSLILHPPSLR